MILSVHCKIQEIEPYDPSLTLRGISGGKFDVSFGIPGHGFLLPIIWTNSCLCTYSRPPLNLPKTIKVTQ